MALWAGAAFFWRSAASRPKMRTKMRSMKVLITGICGFVGNALARRLVELADNLGVFGIDNLMRPGSETNRRLKTQKIRIFHGDIRCASDLETLPSVDFVIDAAANPSVLAGVDGKSSSRQLLEHNLMGTLNLLEFCRREHAGFILLSTSRVYSIKRLSSLPIAIERARFQPRFEGESPEGITQNGVSERFSTEAPISLYGASKLASETLALEYGETFDFPVWINRCGVLAGAGQFGTSEQGIFSYWLHGWKSGQELRYIGFRGQGFQVRDAFHPDDLADLVLKQLSDSPTPCRRLVNVGGGLQNSMSLRELSDWCTERFGPREVLAELAERAFDIPWLVMDSAQATRLWAWQPRRTLSSILGEIADHAEAHPNWLTLAE